jgi:hypothetical protein
MPLRAFGMVAVILATAAGCGGRGAAPSASGLARCEVASLRATAGLQGATGSQLGGVRVWNRTPFACTLPLDPPRLAIILGGRVLSVRQLSLAHGQFPLVRVLAPGKNVFAQVQWFNWCAPSPAHNQPVRLSFEIALPGSRGDRLVPLSGLGRDVTLVPRCDDPDEGSTLTVTPFERTPP